MSYEVIAVYCIILFHFVQFYRFRFSVLQGGPCINYSSREQNCYRLNIFIYFLLYVQWAYLKYISFQLVRTNQTNIIVSRTNAKAT